MKEKKSRDAVTRMQELIEIFCDADRRLMLTTKDLEQYCPTVAAAMDTVV